MNDAAAARQACNKLSMLNAISRHITECYSNCCLSATPIIVSSLEKCLYKTCC